MTALGFDATMQMLSATRLTDPLFSERMAISRCISRMRTAKAQKAKTSSITKSKADAPPREADGSLKIILPSSPQTSSPQSAGSTAKATKLSRTPVNPAMPHIPSPVRPTIPTIIEPVSEPKSETPSTTNTASHQAVDPSLGSPAGPSDSRPTSPALSISPASASTPVSGDVLLPMIIFSVVKSNPPRLVSNLLFTQRFRNQSVGGEESYCLINLMAVAEFLENVDLAALGLSDSDKVMRFVLIDIMQIVR